MRIYSKTIFNVARNISIDGSVRSPGKYILKSNQFEDLDRQGYSILFDDDLPPEEKKLAEQRKQLQQEQDKHGSD